MRQDGTSAENLLWSFLRNRGLKQAKFSRQVPFEGYILDFYCHAAGLAVEVNGGSHASEAQREYDRARTLALESAGIRVLRYWNQDVLNHLEDVLADIDRALPDES
jgi:very-short-patch-repair endonuclease